MEEKKAPEKRNFFRDVLWYYYKWHIVAGVFALFVAALIVVSFVSREDPDMVLVLGTYEVVDESALQPIADAAEAALREATERDDVYVTWEVFLLGNDGDSVMQVQAMDLTLFDNDRLLYVFDEALMKRYLGNFGDSFEPLASFGFGGEHDPFLGVEGSAYFTPFPETAEFYAAVRAWSYVEGDGDAEARWNAAAALFEWLGKS